MKLLLFAAVFLIICLGIAVIAAIPLLFSLSRRQDEVASSLNVSTQFQIKRYNMLLESYEQAKRARQASQAPLPLKPKKPNLQPLKGGKDGLSTPDSDLPR